MLNISHDGLSTPWHGRVWLNPPYSREAVLWLRKLAKHGRGTALVFARTETAWFFETVWRAAAAVLFLEGRIHFHHPDGRRASANAGAPSCLVAYGDDDARRLALSHLSGHFVSIPSTTNTSPANTSLPATAAPRVDASQTMGEEA